jgi:hypothetical protein
MNKLSKHEVAQIFSGLSTGHYQVVGLFRDEHGNEQWTPDTQGTSFEGDDNHVVTLHREGDFVGAFYTYFRPGK